MKKVLSLVLALALAFSLAACGGNSNAPSGGTPKPPSSTPSDSTTSPPASSQPSATPEVPRLVNKAGDTAEYGTYNGKAVVWQALALDLSDEENQKALLIAKDCVAMLPFLTEGSGDIYQATWENSTIRPWLNGEFFNAAFNAEQQAKILDTQISTPPNSESGAEDTSQTTDKVFLLSEAEVRQYFANDEAMAATYNDEPIPVAWWTRTPGNDLSGRVCTFGYGGLYMIGNQVTTADGNGVRPAIWVDITPEDESGTSNPTASQGGNNQISGNQIITEDKATGADSTAKMYYFAESTREEFTFDNGGTLIRYLRIYTFEDGADKERAKENAIANGVDAGTITIEGNTLVIEGDYSAVLENKDVTYEKVKGDLDENGTKYTEK